jgi:hypothetical protein
VTTVFSNLHRVEVRASAGTELARKAAGLSAYSWSDPLEGTGLGQREARANPAADPEGCHPDRAPSEVFPNAQMWIWSNKLIWDTTTQRAYGIGSPHNPFNFWSTTLWVYDRATGIYQTYECPLNVAPSGGLNPAITDWPGTAGHLFDNNCIAHDRRRLYKWTLPTFRDEIGTFGIRFDTATDIITYPSGYTGHDLVRFTMGAAGGAGMRSSTYPQPQIIGLDLDQITMARSSAEYGAARVEIIDRPVSGDSENTTAPSMDYMPNMGPQGSLVVYHKNRYWIYDFDSEAWSDEYTISGMTVTNAFHNVGHRNPNSDLFVFGGGSYDGENAPTTRVNNRQFYTLDNSRTLTEMDTPPTDPNSGLPIVVSVNNGLDEPLTRGVFMYDPGSVESLVFHDNGYIYALDTEAGTWRTVGTKPYEVDWACAIPAESTGQDYGVIMTGHSNVSLPGESTIRLYRAS